MKNLFSGSEYVFKQTSQVLNQWTDQAVKLGSFAIKKEGLGAMLADTALTLSSLAVAGYCTKKTITALRVKQLKSASTMAFVAGASAAFAAMNVFNTWSLLIAQSYEMKNSEWPLNGYGYSRYARCYEKCNAYACERSYFGGTYITNGWSNQDCENSRPQ